MISDASVHGRFQPFHNGHLAYVEAALELANRVHIGLTRISSVLQPGIEPGGHRFTDEANPFSVDQRVHIITLSLLGAGVSPDRFDIQPFPIEEPTKLVDRWPRDWPCFTTKVDAWNDQKIVILENAGYTVRVLKDGAWVGPHLKSGTDLRAMMRSGSDAWKSFVPHGAHAYIEQLVSGWQSEGIQAQAQPNG